MKTINLVYTIERVQSGSRTMFYPTVNGKRLTSTNFARKYDARRLAEKATELYGAEKLMEMAQ